jgi:hypothetical protein
MTAHATSPLGLTATACLLTLASCPEGHDPAGGPGSSGTTTGATTLPSDAPVGDSSGGAADAACVDDYHGNQAHTHALDLALDTTDTAFIALGDGLATQPPELGSDELVVCSTAPSDFFALSTACPGYLSMEARALDGGVPELLLYDASIAQGGPPIEQALGDWYGFFLKPIQRHLDGGSHVIEVRHAGGAPQRYGLTVAWLPASPCPP